MLHLLVLLAIVFGAVLALALHFLPTIVAKSRNHPNTIAIFLVNLFLGWTLIGWVVSLIWACTQPAQPVIYAPVYAATLPPSMPPPVRQGYPQTGTVLPPSTPYQGPR